MAFLKVADKAGSTLAADITDVATSLIVATGEGALFPADNFVVYIEDEKILVTTRTADAFNPITRGYDGTTGVAHVTGKAVELRVIAKHITELQTACTFTKGTFTPTIAFGGGNTGITYAVQVGVYTIIGKYLFYNLRIVLTSKGTSTGTLTVKNLPVACSNTSNYLFPSSIHMDNVVATLTQFLTTFTLSNNTYITINKLVSGIAYSVLDTDCANTTVIELTGFYPID